MTTTLKPDATDSELRQYAREWVDLLCTERYATAYGMLLQRATYPGKSWCTSAEDLQAWIAGYGTNEASSDEPVHKVTLVGEALGDPPIQTICRGTPRYPGFIARLDFWLPLDGEWSDLMASFDFIQTDGRLAAVLVALRVP